MNIGGSQGAVGCDGKAKGLHAIAAAMTAAATLTALVGCTAKSANSPDQSITTATDVTLTPVQRQHIHLYSAAQSSFTRTIEANAVVDYDQEQATAVLAPFSGPVSHLLVTVGARVKAGDPLASVNSPGFCGPAISALSQGARDRFRPLESSPPWTQISSSITASRRAKRHRRRPTPPTPMPITMQRCRHSCRCMWIRRRSRQFSKATRPRAPPTASSAHRLRGTVVERLITPGQLLEAATTPCFTVGDLSRVWVMAQVFGEDIGAVHQGDPAEVRTGGADQVLSGTVTNVAAMVDPNTRAVVARVTVNNTDEVLKKQMYVRVLIHSRQQETGMLIPVSAVLRDDENLPFVYVSQPDGRFARRHVTLGSRIADRYDIIEGLRTGDPVVIEGAIFLQFIQNQ